MAPSLNGFMGQVPRRGCSRSLKPISARRALALVIVVCSPTEVPWGLQKCPSLLPSSLLGALPVVWGMGLAVFSEGSGGPNSYCIRRTHGAGKSSLSHAGGHRVTLDLLLPCSPSKRSWKKQPGRNHLDKNNPQSHQNPCVGRRAFTQG